MSEDVVVVLPDATLLTGGIPVLLPIVNELCSIELDESTSVSVSVVEPILLDASND